MKKMISQVLLYSALVVPLSSPSDWQVLKYKKIPGNKVSFSAKQGMTVNVKNSASPIIYPLKKASMVSEVSVKGSVKNKILFKNKTTQGGKKADDYALRVGLVVEGKQTLNFAKKLIAPKWVKTLFALAPKGTGVDHIYFINAAQQSKLVGKKRNHPLSELIKEENPWLLKFDESGNANFDFKAKLAKPKKVLALWISIDGDDTKSSFATNITDLTIK